ncbi:MAG: phosphotransferase, partial [Pseudohongiellaceae bacterium]
MTLVNRESKLAQWFFDEVQACVLEKRITEVPALLQVSGDASFRRYFRVHTPAVSFILVDAPPEMEDCRAFVDLSRRFLGAGVPVPEVHAVDYQQGFMCLSDFGDTQIWQPLRKAQQNPQIIPSADHLYQTAVSELLKIQACSFTGDAALPEYSAALLRQEMELFRNWFCSQLLGLTLDDREHGMLDTLFAMLTDSALAQPRVCVHRDYHSRNLMYLDASTLGIIDFQDAVMGPFTYDLVSLIKDCYIAWPREQVKAWALAYARQASAERLIPQTSDADFLRSFDMMGIQRHLKATGIFSRLHIRDGKSAYLKDIPRCLRYLREAASDYDNTAELSDWITRVLQPALKNSEI